MRGLYGKRGFAIELRDRPPVALGANMVRIRVRACGVCGTDLHFLRDMDDWTPLGHEISAEVAQVGPGVTRVRVGDSVVCEDVTQCGACEFCKTGRSRLCRSGYTLNAQPGMSDEMVVHEKHAQRPLPAIDPVTAAMVEPLAVAIRGVNKLRLRPFASLRSSAWAPSACFPARMPARWGAGRVAMFARNPHSRRNRAAQDAAADLGADEIYYTGEEGLSGKGLAGRRIRRRHRRRAAVFVRRGDETGRLRRRSAGPGRGLDGSGAAALDVSDMVFHKKAAAHLPWPSLPPISRFPLK